MSEPALSVWLDDAHVADLVDAGAGLASLRYTTPTVERAAGEPLLSVRLPVRAEAYPALEVRPWLENLAPEGAVRAALAARARLAVQDTIELLRAYGRDCAGAVQFLPPAEEPEPGSHVRWLEPTELLAHVRSLGSAPFAADPETGVRVSLAGIQGKLVVVVERDRIGLPLGSTPSTHLLKPEPPPASGHRFPGIVAAEQFGLRVAHHVATLGDGVGLAVAHSQVVHLDDGQPALLVQRYDRRPAVDGATTRVHQEDACSALGLDPGAKYEGAEGRPSLASIADLLTRHAATPITDRTALLQAVTLSLALGNADLHAKNVSLLLDHQGPRLAPLYDPVPTFVWPDTSRELGMRIGGQYHLDDTGVDDVVAEGQRWGFGRRAAIRIVGSVTEVLPEAAARALTEAHEQGWFDPLLDDVADRVRNIGGPASR